jgi:protein-S-isoprenylcysteine O-methyltransferase Ste14
MLLVLVPYAVVMVLLWNPVVPGLSPAAGLALSVAGALLVSAGAAFVVWGRLALGRYHNLSSTTGVELFVDHHLITSGPYAIVRHPMYLGFAVAVIGSLLLYRTWTIVFLAVQGLVFLSRARREEQALAAQFGTEWEAYRRRVPAIVPRLVRR